MSSDRDTPRRFSLRDVGYRRFQLRLWHGMALDAWLRMMRGNWGKISPSKYPLVATILIFATANQLRKWVSRAVYERDLDRVEISPAPIFVIGSWRSGTTWLHQTLIADPAFAGPMAEACFNPEAFLAGRRLLAPLLRLAYPKKRPMDNVKVSPETAEEDEHAILLSGANSPYRKNLFPGRDIAGTEPRVEEMSEADAAFWRQAWLRFLRRVQLINPGKRLVLKSPSHTGRIREILRQFPDARFVHIVRDPYEIFASGRKVTVGMSTVQALQTTMPSQASSDRSRIERFVALHAAYHAEKGDIPEGHLVTVRYEDMKADPMQVLRQIYATLEIGDFEAAAPHFRESVARAKGYRPNKLSLEPGVVATIDAAWGDYFDRYGYQRMSARARRPQA